MRQPDLPLGSDSARRPWIEVTTLGDLLDRQVTERPDSPALAFPEHKVTYRGLGVRSDFLARGLIGLGVRHGTPVGILLANGVDSLACMFAAAKIGAVPVPINTRFKPYELGQVIAHSGIQVLFTSTTHQDTTPNFVQLLEETIPALREEQDGLGARLSLAEAPELARIVTLGSAGLAALTSEAEFGAVAANVPDSELRRRQMLVRVRDTAIVMYTSGTTSSPKGAMLSHEAFSRFAAATVLERFQLTPEDRIWTALPLFHIGGLAFAVASVYAGASYHHPGFFEPSAALDQIESAHCTVALPGFETIWLPVVNRPDFAERDLSALRLVMAVGVPERLRDMAGRPSGSVLVSCFGMTEACSFLSLNRPTDTIEQRVTTGGHPLPGMECRVIDPATGSDVPPNIPGELLFRGSNCFDGYYRDPELTAASFDTEGWFHTGDVATMDSDGRINFVGRLKDMLKVGGENVAAGEVEGFLLTHPAVRIAQVVAAPDEYYVEVPAAYLELEPGAVATEREIIEFCLGRIATFRVPRYVRFVTDWPMSGTKIKKYVLRERMRDELRAEGRVRAPKLRPNSSRTAVAQ